jgi:hypothetical protein
MLLVFAPGRGNYGYISREREWQQNVGFFGKALVAHDTLMRVLGSENVANVPEQLDMPDVARFEFFRHGDRPAGVWLVRQGLLRFALPVTTGPRPGIADYLPAPHGLPGFAAPVEISVPAGTSYYEMPDGATLAAADGADEIEPAPDGRALRVRWRRMVPVGGNSGRLIEPGFEVSTTWRIEGATLVRTETLTATRDVTIKRLWLDLSSTATRHAQGPVADGRGGLVRLSGPDGVLEAHSAGDLPIATSIREVGDEPLGRGPRLPIPTHVMFEAADVALQAGRPRSFVLSLTVADAPERTAR